MDVVVTVKISATDVGCGQLKPAEQNRDGREGESSLYPMEGLNRTCVWFGKKESGLPNIAVLSLRQIEYHTKMSGLSFRNERLDVQKRR